MSQSQSVEADQAKLVQRVKRAKFKSITGITFLSTEEEDAIVAELDTLLGILSVRANKGQVQRAAAHAQRTVAQARLA